MTQNDLKTLTLDMYESEIIENGYVGYSFNAKTGIFSKHNHKGYSSMVHLCTHYIHPNDPIMTKVNSGTPVTMEEREDVIVFGLLEAGKPPHLLSGKFKSDFQIA